MARLQLPIVSRVKHSGNTIVVFCIERAGRSRRLSCSTQGYCGGTRAACARMPANGQCFWNLVETTTAIDDLASAFVTRYASLGSPPRPRRGHGFIFNHLSLDKGDTCKTSNHSAPRSRSHPLCSQSPLPLTPRPPAPGCRASATMPIRAAAPRPARLSQARSPRPPSTASSIASTAALMAPSPSRNPSPSTATKCSHRS